MRSLYPMEVRSPAVSHRSKRRASHHKKMYQKKTILLLSVLVSRLNIPVVDNKLKITMINYTAMAEYEVQEGQKSELHVWKEEIPLNKKHRKH